MPSTGTFYQTLGWQVGVKVNGGYYSVGYKTRGTSMQVDERDYGGLRYTLWKIPFNTIVKDLRAKYPSVDFSSLQDRNVNSVFYFDAIVRIYTNGSWTGDINNNGTTSWGYVYRSHYELAYGSYVPWGTTLINQMKALFDIAKTLPGSAKPKLTPPAPYATIIEPGRSGWPSATYPTTHYHVNGSNDYWVNLRDQFTIYAESSISASEYGSGVYPDYNYISLAEGGSTANGKESSYYSGTITGVGPYFANNFTSNWADSSVSKKGTSAYRYSRFVMKAKRDNVDYKLWYTAVKASNYKPWAETSQWLRTDGTGPTTNWAPAHRINNINELWIQQQGIYDTRSGFNASNSVHAYVYPDGASNHGSAIGLYKINQYFDYGQTVNLQSHLGNTYGNIRVEVWAVDNVGNWSMLTNTTVYRPHPKPTTESVTIKDYEYEDSTTKWVQAGNEFQIDQRGYNSYMYPTQSNIRISNNSDHENPAVSNAYSMTTSTYGYWGTNNKNIVKSRDTRLSLWDYNGNHYGQGVYYFKINSNLNGQKFQVWGLTELNINGGTYLGSWVKEPKLLGIDAVAPRISFVKTGRDEIKVTVSDAESGVKGSKVVLDDGTEVHFTTSKVVNLNGSKNAYIESTDNVGNVSKVSIGDIKTKVTSTLTTEVVTISGRKMLKVTATGRVTNPVPGKVMTWRLKGTGDGIRYTDATNKIINSATGGSYDYSTNIDDVYNQSFGPPLRKGGNIDNVAYVELTHINDIDKAYSFSLEEKYDYESSWTVEKSHNTNFNSGRKHYKFEVLKLSDKDFNPISPSRVNNQDTMTGNRIDFNYYETGDYKVRVTMYDYNNNPSGTTELPFRHIQPLVYTKLEGEVTAIKDLAWEKETYPIDFADTGKFPLGEAYKFNGNGIKLGYGVNFNFKIPTSQTIDNYKIEYSYYSSDGQLLTGYSNGKSFTDSDRQDGSSYTVQNSNFSFNGRFVYVKHFAPADATFKLDNGSTYNGLVTVRAKMTFSRGSYSTSKTIDLYTVTTDETAFDDLQLDKQR